MGPGSLYTSLITNLLVDGIPAALGEARGVRVFICNLMTQANESLGLTASEHIERIYEHTRAADLRLRHREHGDIFCRRRWRATRPRARRRLWPTCERIEALGVRCIAGDFASEGNLVRHKASRLADVVLELAQASRRRSHNS